MSARGRRTGFAGCWLAAGALLAWAAEAACSADGSGSDAPVYFEAYGTCGTPHGYAVITGPAPAATYCGADFVCAGAYYALCDGRGWYGCACDPSDGGM